jgi:CBS-domain-containing membrane protein
MATAQDLMIAAPPMAPAWVTKADVLAMVAASLSDTVAVVDDQLLLIGEISRDRLVSEDLLLASEEATAIDLMTCDPLTCQRSTPASELARMVVSLGLHKPVFVLDERGSPDGIIPPCRLAELMANQGPESCMN